MVISQDDIDELLNGALEEPTEDGASTNNSKVKDEKVYKSPKIEAKRISFPYQSPIIKSCNIVYNPQIENDTYPNGKKVIVRSLDNYIEYITKREQL